MYTLSLCICYGQFLSWSLSVSDTFSLSLLRLYTHITHSHLHTLLISLNRNITSPTETVAENLLWRASFLPCFDRLSCLSRIDLTSLLPLLHGTHSFFFPFFLVFFDHLPSFLPCLTFSNLFLSFFKQDIESADCSYIFFVQDLKIYNQFYCGQFSA